MICLLSKSLKMRRSLVNLSGLLNAVTKVVTGCLRMTKVTIFEELSQVFREIRY